MNHPHPSRHAALRRLAAAVLCAGAGLAQAQIAATPYGQTVLDFGRANGGAQATSCSFSTHCSRRIQGE